MSQQPPNSAQLDEWRRKLAQIRGRRSEDTKFALHRLLKSGGFEPFEVRLSSVKPGADENEEYERGYYGSHLGRAWTVGEVAQIQGNPLFQKIAKASQSIVSTKPDGTIIATPNSEAEKITPGEYEQFANFKAQMIQQTFAPEMGITKEAILNDAAYLNFHWLRLMEESGMGLEMEKDLRAWFRQRGGQRFSVVTARETEHVTESVREAA